MAESPVIVWLSVGAQMDMKRVLCEQPESN